MEASDGSGSSDDSDADLAGSSLDSDDGEDDGQDGEEDSEGDQSDSEAGSDGFGDAEQGACESAPAPRPSNRTAMATQTHACHIPVHRIRHARPATSGPHGGRKT